MAEAGKGVCPDYMIASPAKPDRRVTVPPDVFLSSSKREARSTHQFLQKERHESRLLIVDDGHVEDGALPPARQFGELGLANGRGRAASTAVITSPTLMPASAAGVFGATLMTRKPASVLAA